MVLAGYWTIGYGHLCGPKHPDQEQVPVADQSGEHDRQGAKARFAELKTAELKTGRAWALKEALRELWSYKPETWATKF